MKKIYAVALSAIMAGTAFAGETLTEGRRVTAANVLGTHPERFAGMTLDVNTPSRAPMSAIINPPGEKISYVFTGTGLLKSAFGAMPGDADGPTDIVWDRDNKKAYIHTPIAAYTAGYVEGDISDDGKTITVELPQLIGFLSAWDEDNNEIRIPLYISVMEKESTGGDGITYMPVDKAQNKAIYSVTEGEKVITMTSPYQKAFEQNSQGQDLMPDKFLSVYLVYPKSLFEQLAPGEEDVDVIDWYLYGNINQQFGPLPSNIEEYAIPDNLTWDNNWRISGVGVEPVMCSVAIDGNTFYVDGLIPNESGVVVGTLNGDQVTFKNNQYMGLDAAGTHFKVLQGVNTVDKYDPENKENYIEYSLNGEDMVFNWDADNNELVFEGINKGWALNSSFVRVYYYAVYKEPEIVKQTEDALCIEPNRPHIISYWPSNEGTHLLEVQFDNIAVDGVVLDRNNLSFSMYIDNELFTFDKARYRTSADLTEIPITYNKGKIFIMGASTYITIFDDDIAGKNTLGIRTVNNAPDGKKYYSAMTAVNLDGGGVGIEAVEADNIPVAERYVDMQGREILTPQAGQMVIKIAAYADGSVKATKMVK